MNEAQLRANGWCQRPDGEWEKPSGRRSFSQPTPKWNGLATPPEGPNSLQGRPAKVSEGKEAPLGEVPKNERALHDTFEGWCRVTGHSYIHSRMDKRSTIRSGWPDYTIFCGGRAVCVEFKFGDGKLRPEQEEVIAELLAGGTPVLVTNDCGAAILWTKAQFYKQPTA